MNRTAFQYTETGLLELHLLQATVLFVDLSRILRCSFALLVHASCDGLPAYVSPIILKRTHKNDVGYVAMKE